MKALITGGAGYIGSTVVTACADAGIVPVILDDLSTGRIEFTREHAFYHGDIADGALVDRIVRDHPDVAAVVHCAAQTVVPDSVEAPLGYYRSNVGKTIELLQHLRRNGTDRVILSSSAAIYADENGGSISEAGTISPSSPYARTKAMVEDILRDAAAAGEVRAVALRYFNPIGADPHMRTGLQIAEPTHVLGKLITAARRGEPFMITGVDWPTRDGSGIRDFIHVWDLALAHVRAIERFDAITSDQPFRAINLGGGHGTTVRELVAAFEKVIGRPVDAREAERRPGDVAGGYAAADLAGELLGWRAERSLEEGIRDSLTWAEKYFGGGIR